MPGQAKRLPSGYGALLTDIKARIRTAQIKASLSVNKELIQLYWSIGRDIVLRQRKEGWGKAVIDRLSVDIQGTFPGIAGFSPSNIGRMKAFYQAWLVSSDSAQSARKIAVNPISAQAVRKLDGAANVSQAARELERPVLPQPVIELGDEIPPRPVAEIPWGHNVILIEKLKDVNERLWYARQTVANGWSRSMLEHWIESDLYSRQGKAITNFASTLPAPQSDLAAEVIKDPYNFDFLTLRTDAAERELEHGLLDHIRNFLLELGAGFAFVGQQVHLEIDGEDYYLDLLFYHLRLRCHVVIDLKTRPFMPEYAGKMNFYLSAVDDLMRHPDDKPSIGLILCKTRSKVIAEYALRYLARPVGVARYITRLVESLPARFRGILPAPKEIEAELSEPNRKDARGGKP